MKIVNSPFCRFQKITNPSTEWIGDCVHMCRGEQRMSSRWRAWCSSPLRAKTLWSSASFTLR